MASGERAESRGWWKRIAIAFAAIVGAAAGWGLLRPLPMGAESAREERSTRDETAPSPAPEPATLRSLTDAARAGRMAPAWVRPTILWTIGLVVAVGLALWLLGVMREVALYLLLALFFSFALEPAVNFLHERWRWRRGAATGLLLAAVFVFMVVLVGIFIPTVLQGAAVLADRLAEAAEDFEGWSADHIGVHVSTASLQSGAETTATFLEASSRTPLSVLLGFTASLVGGIFAAFTVGMLVFYMVADAPRFKRSVLSFFPERRQVELVSIWEAAIEKTGGYFYSKLLLAAINGGLFYVVLRFVGVPGAAALALFEGSVAAFIPIVGTYLAAIVPIVMAFITVGWDGTLVILIYVLIYQQVENYLISPKIQGKTLQLHPAVAFVAALAGGAIGGLLWAFLALPFAATIQASASLWIERHEVVESDLIEEPQAPSVVPEPGGPSLGRRVGGWLHASRGWLRRRRREDVVAEPAAAADDGAGS